MARIPHGSAVRLEEVRATIEAVKAINDNSALPFNFVSHSPLTNFGYMFGGLQSKAAALLPASTDEEVGRTVNNLKLLGATMLDKGADNGGAPDSGIPSLYTYFGQFVAHDITLEAVTKDINLDKPDLRPLTEDEVRASIKNTRVATLDLDSIYGNDKNPVPRADKDQKSPLLKLGPVSPTGFPAAGDIFKDVPREGYNHNDLRRDRAALIGDFRNDENVITSQLNVAFLRAHNALVNDNHTFDEARVILCQHFQWVVLDDFLNRVADPEVVKAVLADPKPTYDPPESDFFLPLEFTAAAFRFGHSMTRDSYDYNRTLSGPLKARLYQLFDPLGVWVTLPDMWVIEWGNFVNGDDNFARRIDTQLVEPLFHLVGEDKKLLKNSMANLAVRNLLRGYILRLPTGQAAARELGLEPMNEAEVIDAAASQEQKDVLAQTGLAVDTPLWFYTLTEAAHERAKAEKEDRRVDHLGPVGSRIVAEVLIGLIRRSNDSILGIEGWEPTLPRQGERFVLPDILRWAGVLS
jgi:hypothetical protein